MILLQGFSLVSVSVKHSLMVVSVQNVRLATLNSHPPILMVVLNAAVLLRGQ